MPHSREWAARVPEAVIARWRHGPLTLSAPKRYSPRHLVGRVQWIAKEEIGQELIAGCYSILIDIGDPGGG
jgi:hypothetical protein